MLRMAADWGRHAAGFAYWKPDGALELFKRAAAHGMTGPELILRNHGRRFNALCEHTTAILHTRTGTHGENVDSNAHPFVKETSAGLLAWAHNGIVSNYRDIADEFNTPSVVDSQCLGALIEQRRIGLASGSIGLVWLHAGEVYCYRRSQRLCILSGLTTFGRLTVAATDMVVANMAPWLIPPTEFIPEQGSCYKLTESGPVEVWEDLSEFPIAAPRTIHTGYVGRVRYAAS